MFQAMYPGDIYTVRTIYISDGVSWWYLYYSNYLYFRRYILVMFILFKLFMFQAVYPGDIYTIWTLDQLT